MSTRSGARRANGRAAMVGVAHGNGRRHRPGSRSRIVMLSAVGAAVAGLAVSAYLTVAHFVAPGALTCPSGPVVNCERVTTSPQSSLLGIPVAVLGLAWFAVMFVLVLPPLWRRYREWQVARLSMTVTGMGFVLYLLFVEVFQLRAICLWCTVAHVAAFALYMLVLTQISLRRGLA